MSALTFLYCSMKADNEQNLFSNSNELACTCSVISYFGTNQHKKELRKLISQKEY